MNLYKTHLLKLSDFWGLSFRIVFGAVVTFTAWVTLKIGELLSQSNLAGQEYI